VLGLLAVPALAVNAASPTLFAMIVDGWGWRAGEIALVAAAAASWIGMELMSRWYARGRGRG